MKKSVYYFLLILAGCGGGGGGGDGNTPGAPGTLQLLETSFDATEGTVVNILVARSGGNSGVVSVDYATADGTAVGGSDYTAANGTLTYANGVSGNQTISIPITDDNSAEGSESFTVTLSNVSAATLGANSSATVNIIDNDDALVGGAWDGTSTNSFQPGVVMQIGALVLEDGQGRATDENQMRYEFDVSSDGDELSGTMRAYPRAGMMFPGGATVLDGTITGTIVERTSMDVTWTASSGETGDFSLAYDALDYEKDVTLAGVAGMWTFDLPGIFSLTVTIDAAGNVNGQDSNGCVHTGTLTDPASQSDQYNGLLLDWDITDAGSCLIVGNYSGHAVLLEDATDPDVLLINVDDDAIALGFPFTRQ